MDQSVLRNPAPNVVALVRMCGKLFGVRRRGGRVRVEPAPCRGCDPGLTGGPNRTNAHAESGHFDPPRPRRFARGLEEVSCGAGCICGNVEGDRSPASGDARGVGAVIGRLDEAPGGRSSKARTSSGVKTSRCIAGLLIWRRAERTKTGGLSPAISWCFHTASYHGEEAHGRSNEGQHLQDARPVFGDRSSASRTDCRCQQPRLGTGRNPSEDRADSQSACIRQPSGNDPSGWVDAFNDGVDTGHGLSRLALLSVWRGAEHVGAQVVAGDAGQGFNWQAELGRELTIAFEPSPNVALPYRSVILRQMTCHRGLATNQFHCLVERLGRGHGVH